MPTYTENARALKPDTGSLTGSWGGAANTNIFDVFDRALGAVEYTLSGTTVTLTVSDGVVSTAGAAAISFVGSPGGDATVTLAPATLKKVWIMRNAVSDGSDVIISQGSGSNVTIPPGYAAIVAADGGGVGANIINLLPGLVLTSIQGTVETASQPTIDHDSLANYVANEHVDHSAVAITGGVGLGGGGDITANRSIDLAINTLTAESTVDGANDEVVMYDASAAGHRRVTVDDLVAGSAGSGVASVTAGEGLANDGSASAVDLSIALEEIATAALLGSDFLVGVTGAGAHKKQAITNVGLSLFNNDAGFLATAVEDIDVGTLGAGLDGSFSAATGSVTLDLSLDLSELTTQAAMLSSDYFVISTAAGNRRVQKNDVSINWSSIQFVAIDDGDIAGSDFPSIASIGVGRAVKVRDETQAELAFFDGATVPQQSDPGVLTGTPTNVQLRDAYNNLRSILAAYNLI